MHLLRVAAQADNIEVVMEEGAQGDPQSNGLVENAVRSIKEQVLTMKLGLERRLHVVTPDDHSVLTWLVSHAAEW